MTKYVYFQENEVQDLWESNRFLLISESKINWVENGDYEL